jgi:hypothetical protein
VCETRAEEAVGDLGFPQAAVEAADELIEILLET